MTEASGSNVVGSAAARAPNSSPLYSVRFRSAPDRLRIPPPGWGGASNRLRPAVPSWYDRRRHPWEGAPMSVIRRREFVTLLGGAAAAWPLAARAQQPSKARRIGVLTGGFGPDSQARLEAFLKALAQLGWTDGQNVRLEIRRGGGDADAIRRYATELAALAPDVIMAVGGTATGALLQATRTVPIVFA